MCVLDESGVVYGRVGTCRRLDFLEQACDGAQELQGLVEIASVGRANRVGRVADDFTGKAKPLLASGMRVGEGLLSRLCDLL